MKRQPSPQDFARAEALYDGAFSVGKDRAWLEAHRSSCIHHFAMAEMQTREHAERASTHVGEGRRAA